MVNRLLKRENSDYIKNSIDNVLSCFELNERYSAAPEFAYDAMGNRISKLVKTRTGTGLDTENHWIKTYYVRDAQGNVMATYERTWMNMVIGGYDSSDNLTLKEQDIYGSSRLGLRRPNLTLAKRPFNIVGYQQGGPYMVYSYAQNVTVTGVNPLVSQYEVGRTQYELSNHLGNVLTVISDNVWADGGIDHPVKSFSPDVLAVNDYYPGGMLMPGRSYSSDLYRYGFQGQEKDDEIKGSGNSYDFGARIHDPRIGRWLSVDPLQSKYPSLSPYGFAGNSPIVFLDPDGRIIRIFYGDGKYYDYNSELEVPDNAFVKATIAALDQISQVDIVNRETSVQEPTPSKMLETISSDPNRAVAIYESNEGEGNWHNPNSKVISVVGFNSKDATNYISFDEFGWSSVIGTTPPSGGLNHELRHAYNWLYYSEDYRERKGKKTLVGDENMNDASFPNDEEYKVSMLDFDFNEYFGFSGPRESYKISKTSSVSSTSPERCTTCDVDLTGGQVELKLN